LIDWDKIKAGIERLVSDLNGRPGDMLADVFATELVTHLDDALVAYERRQIEGHDFAHAVRKGDHVEDLRGVLGQLLDLLADWVMYADRDV
jgi:hypothetical protein